MRRVKWYISNGIVGSDREGEFEVDDTETDDEIEAMARDAAFDQVDWSWKIEVD